MNKKVIYEFIYHLHANCIIHIFFGTYHGWKNKKNKFNNNWFGRILISKYQDEDFKLLIFLTVGRMHG